VQTAGKQTTTNHSKVTIATADNSTPYALENRAGFEFRLAVAWMRHNNSADLKVSLGASGALRKSATTVCIQAGPEAVLGLADARVATALQNLSSNSSPQRTHRT
jgi:hypothetical protein